MDGTRDAGDGPALCCPSIKRGRKFDQVVAGAREVFLNDGYEGASVDDIARKAGVSKATLYSYFPDKRLLFLQVAQNECHMQSTEAMGAIDLGDPPAKVLRHTGIHMSTFFLSDFGQRVFRICVAEADRFPELGAHFYRSGPGLIETSLGAYLQMAVDRGELEMDDVSLAAHQFAELCKAQIFVKAVFGIQTRSGAAEIARIVDAAVEMFLCRYGAKRPA